MLCPASYRYFADPLRPAQDRGDHFCTRLEAADLLVSLGSHGASAGISESFLLFGEPGKRF